MCCPGVEALMQKVEVARTYVKCPISKVLIPVDESEHSRRAIQFAGYLGASLSKSLSDITLLRVVTGRYLARHVSYIDFRAEILIESEAFKRIRDEYIEKDIRPLLDEAEKNLKDIGIGARIEKLIIDGDAAAEIIKLADKRNYSAIIMAKRGLSKIKGFLLGSVTNKVVHAANRQTVYIVGQRILKDKACPIPKILIPVDGSSYSMKGVEHAACLAKDLKASMNKITLLRVINLSLYLERLKEGIAAPLYFYKEEAGKILEGAKAVLLKADVPERLITTRVKTGIPSEEILKEAEAEDYNLIIVGRKGRTALKNLLFGGVSSTVLQQCQNPTIAIVSNE
jgi:nucleotide-binding universal stress UspA family protein